MVGPNDADGIECRPGADGGVAGQRGGGNIALVAFDMKIRARLRDRWTMSGPKARRRRGLTAIDAGKIGRRGRHARPRGRQGAERCDSRNGQQCFDCFEHTVLPFSAATERRRFIRGFHYQLGNAAEFPQARHGAIRKACPLQGLALDRGKRHVNRAPTGV